MEKEHNDIAGRGFEPQTSNTDLSFEDAYKQLSDLVIKMEQGVLPLAETVAAYERATKLKAHCELLLKTAETKIEALPPANSAPCQPLE
jgi:exodeoxyribonuclease VII small subunit